LSNFFYPDNLPIIQFKDLIQATLFEHQTIIVAGETGSGKTTQLPKFCLELHPDSETIIGCTQPRRIAAITVAERVKEELCNQKDKVGYKIRFHNHTDQQTKIKFMTDGILLAETRQDPLLKRYSVIIIDEAHERSLNIDFLLGFLKNLLPRRPDLKLIITSATIDTAAFAKHFSKAPVIDIEGRTYPVDIRYSPVEEESEYEKSSYLDHCIQTIIGLHNNEAAGDILAFLPTEKDIRSCCNMLRDKIEHGIVLPLFGRLSAADQKRIFRPHKSRKIVVATNVAETSITVPNIRYVVDSGLARISYYNSRAKTTSLPIKRISRASCDQRKGRCGRVGPGICVRLFSEDDYSNRPKYSLPEIQRSNLAEVILQMISLKLGRPEQFPFIDIPSHGAIRDGYRLLTELGAINSRGHLTSKGLLMAKLPIDPCISRIIIEAKKNNCLREIKIIGSALAIQDPRVRPAEFEKQADLAHKKFSHPHSDFMGLLKLWNHFYGAHDQVKSWSRLKKFCKQHFLSFQRMREWFDLHEQMSRILKRHGGFTDNTRDGSYEAIHKSLVSGFLRNICCKKKDKIYQGAGNRELMIFPGSHQFLKGGNWIIAASFLETNRLYGLTVATIEPDWLESMGGELCKYSWTNPRWQKKSGRVVCDERVSLFGLTIVHGRTINFGRRHPKNRKEAQNIFIERALLQGEITGNYSFLLHNRTLIEKWRDSEEKLRKRDIVIDDYRLHDFYTHKLPSSVYDRSTLNGFLKKNKDKNLLKMTEDDILNRRPEEHELVDYPSALTINSTEFNLTYNFQPGTYDDGVTIRIPIDLAGTLKPALFEWLVPGLLREKTIFLFKGLAKNLRKQLVPLNQTVDMVMDDISPYRGSYYRALENSLFKFFAISLRRSDWPESLPPHLQMRFLLFDPSGKTVATGRDLSLLISNIGRPKNNVKNSQPARKDKQLIAAFKNKVFNRCNFDTLPDRITLYSGQKEVSGYLYPTLLLTPEKNGVTITFENDINKSSKLSKDAVLYLYRFHFSNQYKSLKKNCSTALSGPSSLWLVHGLGGRKIALETILHFITHSIFNTGKEKIPSKVQFDRTVAEIKEKNFYQLGLQIFETVMRTLRKRAEVRKKIGQYTDLAHKNHNYDQSRFEMYEQLLLEILPHNFLKLYSVEELEDCNRYMNALIIRIERAHINPAKDKNKAEQLIPYLNNLQSLEKYSHDLSEEYQDHLKMYQRMIQEFRISLFAPEMKTKITVSAKKLKQQFDKIREFT